MIVGQGQVHHRTRHNLTIAHHRPVLDRMHTQNRALGRVQDRRRKHRAVDAAVADAEGAPLQIGDGQAIGLDLLGKSGNGLLDFIQLHAVGVAQDRHHQPLFTADGDADIVKIVQNDVIAVDAGIDVRKLFQRLYAGLDEEGHEAQRNAVALHEMLALTAAQLLDTGQIGLVEGRQHGGLLAGGHQALGNPLADRRHRAALLATGGVKRRVLGSHRCWPGLLHDRRRRGRRNGRLKHGRGRSLLDCGRHGRFHRRCHGPGCGRLLGAFLDAGKQVVQRDASPFAGPGHLIGADVALKHLAPERRGGSRFGQLLHQL